MQLTRRRLTIAGLGGGLAALTAFLLRPRALDVDTALAVRAPLRVTVDAEGRTQVRDRFVVTAPVAGRLERIALAEGAPVRAGEVIARIAPVPLDSQAVRLASARVDGARAAVHEAESQLGQARAAEQQAARVAERRSVLYAAGAISQEQRDEHAVAHQARAMDVAAASARLAGARAEVAAARAALVATGGDPGAMIAVRAPCGGSVLRVPERSERVVAAGAPLLELGNPRALEVIVDVLSTDAVRLVPGAPAEIDEWGGERTLAGRVRTVEPAAFTRVSALGVDEQRVNVRVDVLGAPAALGDGFRVATRMLVWAGRDVLQVPASAVVQRDGDWAVFVVRDGRARLEPVAIGQRAAAAVEIVRGLAPGAEVILFPSDQIADGARVRARRTRWRTPARTVDEPRPILDDRSS